MSYPNKAEPFRPPCARIESVVSHVFASQRALAPGPCLLPRGNPFAKLLQLSRTTTFRPPTHLCRARAPYMYVCLHSHSKNPNPPSGFRKYSAPNARTQTRCWRQHFWPHFDACAPVCHIDCAPALPFALVGPPQRARNDGDGAAKRPAPTRALQCHRDISPINKYMRHSVSDTTAGRERWSGTTAARWKT